MIDSRHGPSIPRLLFAVLGAPVIWATHLGVIYFLQTLDCITAWDGGRRAILLATLALGAIAATAGWTAWRLHRRLGGEDVAAPERDGIRFLLVLGIGAGVLFTATIVLEGVSPLLAPLCS